MKNIIKFALIAAMLTALTAAPVNASVYCRIARITKVRQEVITTLDTSGNIWKFRGQGFRKGENLILVMDSNHTRRIKDDMVIDVIRLWR